MALNHIGYAKSIYHINDKLKYYEIALKLCPNKIKWHQNYIQYLFFKRNKNFDVYK